MTNLPDWLVERVVLDEVAPQSRARLDGANARELADRVDALRAENAAELAAYPARAAIAQIEARVVAERRTQARRRSVMLGALASAVAIALVVLYIGKAPATHTNPDDEEVTRVKGQPRLVVFRQSGDGVERLDEDSVVRAGDVLQVRYKANGRGYGVIASVDGRGVVTLHYPVSEDAPREATALAQKTTSLPNAYALDDAPQFERFFFITADEPIDVGQSLASVRSLAQRADSATASLELPADLRQWSLRLRKPNQKVTP